MYICLRTCDKMKDFIDHLNRTCYRKDVDIKGICYYVQFFFLET